MSLPDPIELARILEHVDAMVPSVLIRFIRPIRVPFMCKRIDALEERGYDESWAR